MNKKQIMTLLLCLCLFTLLLAGCRKTTAELPADLPSGPEPSLPVTPDPRPVEDDERIDLLPYFIYEQDVFSSSQDAPDGTIILTASASSPRLFVETPESYTQDSEETGATEAAADLINQYFQDKLSDIDAYVQFELGELAQELYHGDPEEFVPFALEVGFHVTRSDGVMFSTLREYYDYQGGAYPNVSYRTENFLVNSGVLLTLDDVFAVEQDVYYTRIHDLVLAQTEERQTQNGLEYISGFEELLMQRFSPTDFVFDEAGIRFIWQEGALGPQALGAQTFILSYEELGDIMEAKWIPQVTE